MIHRQVLCRTATILGRESPRRELPRRVVRTVLGSLTTKRFRIGDTGDNKTGHISTSPEQGIVFFNGILPPGLQILARLSASLEKKGANTRHITESLGVVHPQTLFNEAIKGKYDGQVSVAEVLPRMKEGGAFVKFNHDVVIDPEEVGKTITEFVKQHHRRSWWNPLDRIRASLVRGKPWVEDLSRLPSRRLRVEFLPTEPGNTAAELGQEELYSFFRPFGKLSEIVTQPSDSKVLPRFAYLDFSSVSRAILAKNCLHGYVVAEGEGGGKSGTLLRLNYERKERFKWAKDAFFNHPRILFPLLAALVATITVAVFDPIRTWSIKQHITRTFHLEDNFIFRWFRRHGQDILNRVRSLGGMGSNFEASMQVVWEDRKSDTDLIQGWLMESAETFIIVQGPRGSGKNELVKHALQRKMDAHKVLWVDCKPVAEARGDANTIAAAANQVGYRPVFSWINNISGFMDLAAQSLTGVKAGFSQTLENQLDQIWTNTSAALKGIALGSRKSDDVDAGMSDDEYLEAHPERRPVVVIDHYLHKNIDPGATMVYDKLAQWAAELTTTNVAHVIFLTNDVSYGKYLSKALPDRVFRQIALGDCSPSVAKRYVINHLDFDSDIGKAKAKETDEEEKKLTPSQKRKDLHELDDVIDLLGGRLTDLDFLARRIKAGESPTKAVREIINQSASEILKMFLQSSSEEREWSSLQAWTLIKNLASNESLRYNEVLLGEAFKTGGEKALAALEQAELISVQTQHGRPISIKPGKPIYRSAFQRLVDDNVLRAKMNLALLSTAIGNQSKTIEKLEQELKLLGELPKQPYELRERLQWLLTNIAAAQKKIGEFEAESAELKKTLTTEY